jgi:GGDEF domain-containing protein
VLSAALQEVCPAGFLGHIGGDDFVVLLPEASAIRFGEVVREGYDAATRQLYADADIAAGGISAQDRQGKNQKFPFISLSMAGVPLAGRQFKRFSEVASTAAELKKLAKATPGTVLAMDRRAASSSSLSRAVPGTRPS